MANVTITNLAASAKSFYEKRLLMRAVPRMVHTRFAEKASINGYNALEWRRYAALSAVTSALTEGTTPTEETQPSLTQVTATPSWYGSWLGYSDKYDLTTYDPVLTWVAGVLGEQAGLSVDTIARNYLTTAANTTKDYSNNKTARTSLDSPADDIAYYDILKALAILQAANALPFEDGKFKCVIHPHTAVTLFNDPTFVSTFLHAKAEGDGNPMMTGFIGTFLNCDFFVSSNVREYANGGVSNDDIYSAVFFAKESHGMCGIASLNPKEVDTQGMVGQPLTGKGEAVSPINLIVKDVGSAGSDDPLNQRGTVAWKVAFDVQTLNSAFMVDLEHVNLFSAD